MGIYIPVYSTGNDVFVAIEEALALRQRLGVDVRLTHGSINLPITQNSTIAGLMESYESLMDILVADAGSGE